MNDSVWKTRYTKITIYILIELRNLNLWLVLLFDIVFYNIVNKYNMKDLCKVNFIVLSKAD